VSVVAQDVFTRAIALSDANQGFAGLPASEILARLNLGQRQLNARLSQDNRLFYLTNVVATSTGGASGRTVDLSVSPPFVLPVERVVLVLLPDGVTELAQVDIQDLGAELAPRYYPMGMKLLEVGGDWSPAAGVVNLTVWYVYKQAILALTGDLTQLLQVPDEFAPFFDYELAIYFNQKDLGRATADPTELQRLTAMQETAYNALLQYLDHLHGVARRRFVLPTAVKREKA
jgi:hypothetical protein